MIKAVIFDLDGTMLDTERMSAEAVKGSLISLGYDLQNINIIDWYYENCIGFGAKRIFEKLQSIIELKEDFEYFIKYFRNYRENYFRNTPPLIKKGLLNILEYLKREKIKMAICTGTWVEQVSIKMKSAGVSLDYFDVIVGGDLVKNAKPDPECYLLTCEKLGLKPEQVVAIEDCDTGAMAAIDVGIRLVLVPDIKENSNEIKEKAWQVVNSLDEIIEIIKKEI